MITISEFIRWRDWGPGKTPVIFSLVAYIALARQEFSVDLIIKSALFIGFSVTQSALGYVVNDWGDRRIDKLHGKKNAFENLTVLQGLRRLGALSCIAIFTGVFFIKRHAFLPLWLIWIFFTCAYSLKPMRLKARGAVGLGVSSIAQWTLPVLIAFSAMDRFGGWDMIVFAIANSMSGAALEIAHQRYDRSNDMSTQTKTFATRIKKIRLDRLYSIALILDKLAIGCVVIMVSLVLPDLGNALFWKVSALFLPAIYLSIAVAAILENRKGAAQHDSPDPYYSPGHSANKLLHETLPNLILPGFLLSALMIRAPLNLFLLAGFLYWRLVLGEADWRWPLRKIREYL